MHKDIQQINHLIRWGIMVGLFAVIAIIFFSFFLNFFFLFSDSLIKTWPKYIFLILLALLVTAVLCRYFIEYLANQLNAKFAKRFNEIKLLGTFEEVQPKFYNPGPKLNHVVLLLHGFTASSQQLDALAQKLIAKKIPFYAPNILGFGLNKTTLLQKVRYEDWFREALEHFDHLKMLAENVSIVGHSMGGILATFIASQREVNHLVLSAPAFFSSAGDLRYKRILLTHHLSSVYSWIFPYVPKSLRPNRKTISDTLDQCKGMFQYLSVPTNCIKEIFKVQDIVDIAKARYQSLSLLFGKHDLTIDNARIIAYLHRKNINFTEHTFANSAHNIFEDFEREKVSEVVIDILSSPIAKSGKNGMHS